MNNTTDVQITNVTTTFHVEYIYFIIIPLIVFISCFVLSFLQYHFIKKKTRLENQRPEHIIISCNGRMLDFVPYRLNVPEFLTEFVFNDLNPSTLERKNKNQMDDKNPIDLHDDHVDHMNFSRMTPIESNYHKNHSSVASKGKPSKVGKTRTNLWM